MFIRVSRIVSFTRSPPKLKVFEHIQEEEVASVEVVHDLGGNPDVIQIIDLERSHPLAIPYSFPIPGETIKFYQAFPGSFIAILKRFS